VTNTNSTSPKYSQRTARRAIDAAIAEAHALVKTEPQKALALVEQVFPACAHPPGEKPYLEGLIRAFNIRGGIYLDQADYGRALMDFSEALLYARKTKKTTEIVSQTNSIGIVYAYCGQYDLALEYLRSAEILLVPEIPLDIQAEIYNNIGFTYVNLNDYANGIPYLHRGLELIESASNQKNPNIVTAQADILDSLSQAYLGIGKLKEALIYGQRCLALFAKNNHFRKESEYLLSLGEVHLGLEEIGQAKECYQQGLQIALKNGFRREEGDALRRLGILARIQGDLESALKSLNAALEIAENVQIRREIYECHSALADVYKQMGDYAKALEHYEQFHLIKEVVFNAQSDLRIKNLQVIQQVERAKRENELLQQKSAELEKEIEERKKAQERTEFLARTDALTGVNNRGYFITAAQHFISEALQQQFSLSFILIDVDYFKRVNDTIGHLGGDRVLINIAEALVRMLRTKDLIGRYGGEEFVILLPDTNQATAVQVAERLRETIDTMEILHGQNRLHVTISLGVTSLENNTEAKGSILETLLQQADRALYAAKHQGRNKVILYTNDLQENTI